MGKSLVSFPLELCFYENETLLHLIGRYKLFLWLKEILCFFEENEKDYKKFYHLKQELNEQLIKKYNLLPMLEKEVLYNEFIAFSLALENILQEISYNITDRYKRKEIISEWEIPLLEKSVALLKEKIFKIGLNFPIVFQQIIDFESCFSWSRKASTLCKMITKENKKIDYSSIKILIEFSQNYEYSLLFPFYKELKSIYDSYEGILNKVNSLKTSLLQKRSALLVYKLANLKVVHEKILTSDKFAYTSFYKFQDNITYFF